MNSGAIPPSNLTMAGLVSHVRGLVADLPDAPSEAEIQKLCDILFSASLLKEEGRAVRARVVIAPPDAFKSEKGPPDGTYTVRFTLRHDLSANEIKRLSPAANFAHSAIGIWPDGDLGFRIWGILNTGPRWLNLVAGGRKPIGIDLPHPIIHVRDPGWLLFYHGYNLLAEWRGRELSGPRLDVFQASLLKDRFVHLRRQLVDELSPQGLPSSLEKETYAELTHLIALQFVKRIINLVRSSGHGGTLVMLPEGPAGVTAATRWIDCKYSATPDAGCLRVRHLLQVIIHRVGELSPPNSTLEAAWEIFRNGNDSELDRLEEAFFELARLFSDLMQVDGALVLDQRFGLVGFGGEIRVDRNVLKVDHSWDLDGTRVSNWNVRGDGTRHRSIYRLCSVEPTVIGFVISQDSQVRMIANVHDSVTFWSHTVI